MKHFFMEYGKIIIAGALTITGLMFSTPFAEAVTGSVANFTSRFSEKNEESMDRVTIGLDGSGGSSTPVVDGTNITLSTDVNSNGKVDKGDTLSFATSYLYSGSNTGPTEFLVLNTNGSDVELFAKTNLKTNVFSSSNNTYESSALDTLLNTTYFNSLSDTVKGKIKSKSITQNTWSWQSNNTGDVASWYKYNFTEADTSGSVYSVSKTATGSVLNRNVYALDVEDVVTYLGGNVNPQDLNEMFFGTRSATLSSDSNIVWLHSASSGYAPYAFRVYGDGGSLDYSTYSSTYGVRPAFTITLN